MRVSVPAAIAAVFSLAACGGQSSGRAVDAGLSGVVRVQPATPTCHRDMPCSRPARGVTLVFLQEGSRIASATTDKRGRYRIRLARGRYQVRIGARLAKPATVTVPSGRFAPRNFTYDAGIH